MEAMAFWKAVAQHEKLEYSGIVKDNVAVKNCITTMLLPPDYILKEDWPLLCDLLTGKRPARVLRHQTRIVGYFSSMRNWNGSQLAQSKARQVGDYGLPEQPSMGCPDPVPDEVLRAMAVAGAEMECKVGEVNDGEV